MTEQTPIDTNDEWRPIEELIEGEASPLEIQTSFTQLEEAERTLSEVGNYIRDRLDHGAYADERQLRSMLRTILDYEDRRKIQ